MRKWTAIGVGVVVLLGANFSAAETPHRPPALTLQAFDVVDVLQSHRRAVVTDPGTLGKGSLQRVIALRNGAGLELSVAHDFAPAGVPVQGHKIAPNLEVESPTDVDRSSTMGTLADSKVDETTDNQHGGAMSIRALSSAPVPVRALEVLWVSEILGRSP